MKNKFLYTIVLNVIANINTIRGQVGINTAVVEDGVILQLEAPDKGVLFPRVALISRTSTKPLASTLPTGTMIFNTATAGSFPNTVTPGLLSWNAEDQQWTNMNSSITTVLVKYTNSEVATNYNTADWQNIKLFGNKIINESQSVYQINTTNQSVKINSSGLYSISSLLSFDRLGPGNAEGRLSLCARVFVNGIARGTEQVVSPGFTTSITSKRGLFSHSFTEYLLLNDGDVLSVMIKRTKGVYSSRFGTSKVQFLASGDSSISIARIR
ncbi:hypothetical protein DRF65_27205 [Chryseobacterium pennae]|uniref:C1q domain-containing protein n=1 Tax=Chryseobacterium pennae TaxID=2258962 RepID=A0A3D9C0E9_9FLAO|nr:hypothetical protein [Chryseobacterium pennae]REC59219.1 hypothetical protein DRF65_27205 [Chryseobacterium pennae]